MLLLLLALAASLGAAAGSHGWLWQLPDRHNPWAVLRVADPPNWLTRYKLRRLDERPAECRAVLAGADIQATPVPDRDIGPGCGLRNALRVQRTSLRLDTGFVLSCRSAVALALWEQHVVQPAADQWLGTPVQGLQHFGSVACRNVYGRADGARSQHATADALDVAGFVLQGGRRITVARDWHGGGPDARFLHAVHDGACRYFDGVFGPDYNAAHADHLHLDRGPYRVCR